MKQTIHPKNHPVVFVDTSCGAEFITTSSMTSSETRDIAGITHYILPVEISSASHPFYTGKQILIDTSRRVEKFVSRMNNQADVASTRKGKKVKRATKSAKKSEEQAAEATA